MPRFSTIAGFFVAVVAVLWIIESEVEERRQAAELDAELREIEQPLCELYNYARFARDNHITKDPRVVASIISQGWETPPQPRQPAHADCHRSWEMMGHEKFYTELYDLFYSGEDAWDITSEKPTTVLASLAETFTWEYFTLTGEFAQETKSPDI
jgi:hypothetical protein